MAGEKIPSNQPEKLSDILKQEKRDYDCTPCRLVGKLFPPFHALAPADRRCLVLTGGTAFLGLAGYSYVSGMSQLEKQRAVILKSNSWLGMRGRRMGISGLSLGLAYLGLYRLFA